jgi:hypothetical protein
MRVALKQFDGARVADAQRLYEETRVPLPQIAAFIGCSAATLSDRVNRWGWRKRKRLAGRAGSRRRVRKCAVLPMPPLAPPVAPPPLQETAARMRALIERELQTVEVIVSSLGRGRRHIADAERAARTLAHLVRSLKEAVRLAPPAPTGANDEFPRDLDELRRELSRRMEALVTERSAASGGGA